MRTAVSTRFDRAVRDMALASVVTNEEKVPGTGPWLAMYLLGRL